MQDIFNLCGNGIIPRFSCFVNTFYSFYCHLARKNVIIIALKGGGMMAQGKQSDQKMKPYLVYEYLMRYSDANHVVSANELVGYLQECGISAERRSIYKDIEEINKALLLTQRDGYGIPRAETVEEAEELLQDDKEKTIIYDAHRKGFYVRKRHYKVDDIRLLVRLFGKSY